MNNKDIRYRTNCSCMNSSKYTFQLIFGSGLFVISVWFLLIIIGAVLNKEMYTGRAWYAVFNSFIFSLVVTAMAVFVASFEPKENVLNIITQVLSIGMSFLCGIFIPMEVLSDKVLSVARFLPAYWYVKANNMIADIEPFSRGDVLLCFIVAAGFALMLIMITLLVRKVKYSGAAIATTAKKAAVSH